MDVDVDVDVDVEIEKEDEWIRALEKEMANRASKPLPRFGAKKTKKNKSKK